MKRTQTTIITTIVLSITLASVFAFDNSNSDVVQTDNLGIPFAAIAASGDTHNIEMEAVKMPDGMYAYRIVSYDVDHAVGGNTNYVTEGLVSTDPSIPGPTIILNEGDHAEVTLTNSACEDFVIGNSGDGLGLKTYNENSLVGIHVHGVHYDVRDDATYKRVNMERNSAAECNSSVTYDWFAGAGTVGAWPYHDHTFKENEVGSEDLGLFGTVIVNPAKDDHDEPLIGGFVNTSGDIVDVPFSDIEKDFILWMVSSETLGTSIFYGMEIEYDSNGVGKQTALWTNPPLYAEDESKVRFHVLGMGDEVHAFHLHGHRWAEDTNTSSDIIDVEEITPLQRKTFVVQVSDNGDLGGDARSTEGWMYHCHVFPHMEEGMSGMLHVLPKETDDSLPPIGAVFTLSDEPGQWMKTLNAGALEDWDNLLSDKTGGAIAYTDGTGFAPKYLGVLEPGFADTEGRSIAVIKPNETVLFNMKDSQTKHTITTLIYPTEAERLGGNGILTALGLGHFDTQLGIRGSTFLTDSDGVPVGLETPGLYVFVCKIHPYMFSAVVVDDPNTFVQAKNLDIDEFPLLDLSPNLEILTRHINDTNGDGEIGTAGDGRSFPINVSPATPVPLALLKTFSVIVDPSNWKDYTQDDWEVSLIPGLFTTNSSSVVVSLLQPDQTNYAAGILGLKNATGGDEFAAIINANLTSIENDIENQLFKPDVDGIGEVWVNTQFERTLNKNFDGTPNDKPGTITVVNVDKWNAERKIALPEINMNHPHNMWADTKNELVYQTQWFDSKMAVIDRESGELVYNTSVGQSPSHVMTSPTTGKIYIAVNGEEQVTELDPETFEITRQISTGERSHPHGHWVSSDGKYIVTPDFIGLRSSIIDLETGDVVNPILAPIHDPIIENGTDWVGSPVLIGPIATGMKSNDNVYYTADFLGNSLSAIDIDKGSTGEIFTQIDLVNVDAGLPIQTPVSPDNRWMVTANVLGGITVTDVIANEIYGEVLPCDPGCHGVQWGAKEGGGYYAYVSSKFSNALIVVDPDPEGDESEFPVIAGKILLADDVKEIDDRIIGYDGMGGQGVLAIPNVYDGWIQATDDACGTGQPSGAKGKGPCDISKYLADLTDEQRMDD
jgi:DNA-binding beta-propeller fold protein YncE/plastocyanin